MSSISGPDGQYNYYQQQLNDLNDENSSARKKAKEREEERVSRLEHAHERDLRQQKEESDRAITRAKEAADDTLHTERAAAKEQYKDLRKNTYDRFGQLANDRDAEFRHEMEDMQRQYREQNLRHGDELRTAEKNYEHKLADRDQRAAITTGKAVENTRKDLEDTFNSASQSQRDGSERAARDARERYDALNRDRLQDINDQKRRYDSAFEEQQHSLNRQLEHARNYYDRATERQQRDLRDSQTEHADTLRHAHERETSDLRRQLQDAAAAERYSTQSSAKARAETISDTEDQWRSQLSKQEENSRNEIFDLKRQNDRTENYLARQNQDTSREKEAFYTDLLRRHEQARASERKDLTDSFLKDRAQLQGGYAHDRDLQQKLLENRMSEAARRSADALKNQRATLSAGARDHQMEDQYKIDRLNHALQEHETSADTSLVSPAAETALRKQISDQYQKTAQADMDRRSRENEALRDEYQGRFREEHDNNLLRETRASRAIASERNNDRAVFNAHVADLEYMKDNELRSQAADNQRAQDRMTKNYSRVLDRATREHDDAMNATQTEASARLAAFREEAEFNQRMAQREFSNKYNETIREYDKKLADQKMEYEARLDDQRAAAATAARDAENRYKHQLDEQNRANEQRLAQQEAQHKERERYITQTYKDELDKMRHANQMLVDRRRG